MCDKATPIPTSSSDLSPLTPSPYSTKECKTIISQWQALVNEHVHIKYRSSLNLLMLRYCGGIDKLNANTYLNWPTSKNVLCEHANHPNLSRNEVRAKYGCEVLRGLDDFRQDAEIRTVYRGLYMKHCLKKK
jgi:hypothetical protein